MIPVRRANADAQNSLSTLQTMYTATVRATLATISRNA